MCYGAKGSQTHDGTGGEKKKKVYDLSRKSPWLCVQIALRGRHRHPQDIHTTQDLFGEFDFIRRKVIRGKKCSQEFSFIKTNNTRSFTPLQGLDLKHPSRILLMLPSLPHLRYITSLVLAGIFDIENFHRNLIMENSGRCFLSIFLPV